MAIRTGMQCVLLVSTRDRVRSVAAEAFLRTVVPEGTLLIARAGTDALEGLPPHPTIVRALQRWPVPSPEAPSRRINRQIIDDADLVITMDRTERAAVVAQRPQAVRRTFTLGELNRLARLVPPPQSATLAGPAHLVEATPVARARGAAARHEDDIGPVAMRLPWETRRLLRRMADAAENLGGYLTTGVPPVY